MRRGFVLLLLFCLNSYAQTPTIVALKSRIATAATIDKKEQALFALCDQGYTLHPDTLLLYAQQAQRLAVQKKSRHDEAKALYYQSFALTNKGLIDSSLHLADACLHMLAGEPDDFVLQANLLNQKGRCFVRKNHYKEAIDMGYRVIEAAEKGNDELMQVKGKTLIGWAYLEMGQSGEALKWHLAALRTTGDTALLQKYAILYANLALNYKGLGKMDSAFYFINKAIAYARKNENLFALSNALAIQAQLDVTAGQTGSAEQALKETVAIRKLIGDPFYIVSDMAQLGLYYAHYGQPEKGIALCNEGIAIATKYKIKTKLFFLYGTLAENYKAAGNMDKYAGTLEQIIALKDSVYQANSAEALAEMQTKYALQKKETIIMQQQFALAKKNYIIIGALLLFLVLAATSYAVFREYKKRQQIKTALMQQEEKRLSVQAVRDAEEAERNRIAADLHDNLGAQANAILYGTELLQQQHGAPVADLHHTAQDMLTSLRETLWVLKKQDLTASNIWLRIVNFSKQISRHYPALTIKTSGTVPAQLPLRSTQALHIVFIVQEALNNAIRHSAAKDITLTSDWQAAEWQISITDNGTGFDLATITQKQEQYGLSNMKERAAAAQLRLLVDTAITKGTRIQLLIPSGEAG